MTTSDRDRDAGRRRARIEALEAVAAQLEGRPIEIAADDPAAVLFEMSKLAAVFLARSFGAVSDPGASALAWTAFAIKNESANLAELTGDQRR